MLYRTDVGINMPPDNYRFYLGGDFIFYSESGNDTSNLYDSEKSMRRSQMSVVGHSCAEFSQGIFFHTP